MGLFRYTPKVLPKKFLVNVLGDVHRERHWNKVKVNELKMLVQGDLYEGDQYELGIDEDEFERELKWLKENKSKHHLDDEDIAVLETSMRKHGGFKSKDRFDPYEASAKAKIEPEPKGSEMSHPRKLRPDDT